MFTASANLNLLRAFAVILVVQDHILTLFGNPHWFVFEPTLLGRAGVLIFFVHTSLVLMYSLERQVERFGQGGIFRIFMLRRAFRIFPLSIFAVCITFFFHIPLGFLAPHSFLFNNSGVTGFVQNVLLVQNFFKGGSILAPLWSLSYEMQMYLLLPLIFIAVNRWRQFDIPLVAWATVGFAYIVFQHRVDQINAYLPFVQIPEWLLYVPCFLPGIMAYRRGMGRQALQRFSPVWFALLLAGMCVWYMLSYDTTKFIFFALLLGAALPYFRECAIGWLARAGELIARYSYGIYLFHHLSIWLAFGRFRGLAFPVQWTIFVVTLVAIPVVLYHVLEAPMIRLGNRLVMATYGQPLIPTGEQPSAMAAN